MSTVGAITLLALCAVPIAVVALMVIGAIRDRRKRSVAKPPEPASHYLYFRGCAFTLAAPVTLEFGPSWTVAASIALPLSVGYRHALLELVTAARNEERIKIAFESLEHFWTGECAITKMFTLDVCDALVIELKGDGELSAEVRP